MFEFEVIKKFVLDIFKKLGVAGTIAVFLFGIVAVQHEMISYKDGEITKLEQTTKKQNDAAVEAGKQRDALQAQLNGASDKNKILDKQLSDAQDKLKKKPVATTCEGAMNEIRSSTKEISQKWNAQ